MVLGMILKLRGKDKARIMGVLIKNSHWNHENE